MLGLKLSAILWRCISVLQPVFCLQVPTVNCQRYSNWHLHSSYAYWCYLALRNICSSHYKHVIYCTKNKLKKSASSMVFCLTKRLDSSCNLNSLILVNLIKCFCSKAISIWLDFIGRINLRTRVSATCVRTSTTCCYNYGLISSIIELGALSLILCFGR